MRELDSILLPRFAMQLQSRVTAFATDPQNLYAYFKGYLMLGDPAHLDKAYLQQLVDFEWKQGSGEAAAAGPALAKHFTALLENAATLRPLPLNATLVNDARFGYTTFFNSIGTLSAFTNDVVGALKIPNLKSGDPVRAERAGRSTANPRPASPVPPAARWPRHSGTPSGNERRPAPGSF